jgi:hypothetical protein
MCACSLLLFRLMNDFIEHKREPRRFPVAGDYGMAAKRALETLASIHVRFRNAVRTVMDMPVFSD